MYGVGFCVAHKFQTHRKRRGTPADVDPPQADRAQINVGSAGLLTYSIGAKGKGRNRGDPDPSVNQLCRCGG
jgi:hypothetical protein